MAVCCWCSPSALAGGLAFGIAGGPDYTGFGGYAPIFAATGALYALVFVLINAQVAAGARWPSAPLWVGTAGYPWPWRRSCRTPSPASPERPGHRGGDDGRHRAAGATAFPAAGPGRCSGDTRSAPRHRTGVHTLSTAVNSPATLARPARHRHEIVRIDG